jgi:hypothetical protein
MIGLLNIWRMITIAKIRDAIPGNAMCLEIQNNVSWKLYGVRRHQLGFRSKQ